MPRSIDGSNQPAALVARDVALVGLLALVVRLALVYAGPSLEAGDMAGWQESARRVTSMGIHAGYTSLDPGSLYPPAFLYPLWAVGHVYRTCCSPDFVTGTDTLDALMRIGPVLADALLAVLIYVLARTWLDRAKARRAGLLYALCPAALVTVAQQGMIGDPYVGVLVILALLAALGRHSVVSAICLSLAVLTKPQALALVPLVILVLARRTTARQWAAGLLAATLTVTGVLLPFALHGTLSDVWSAVRAIAGLHAYTQNSADNLWTLLPVWRLADVVAGPFGEVPDDTLLVAGLSCRDAGLLACAALQAVTLARLGRSFSPRGVVEAGAVLVLGFFFLSTRMHVNYVFLAFPFLCALAASGSFRVRLIVAAVTLACLVDWQDSVPWAVHRANAVVYAASLVVLGCEGLRRPVVPFVLGRVPSVALQMLVWRRSARLGQRSGWPGHIRPAQQVQRQGAPVQPGPVASLEHHVIPRHGSTGHDVAGVRGRRVLLGPPRRIWGE